MNQKLLMKRFYSNYAENFVSPCNWEPVAWCALFMYHGQEMISIHDVTAWILSSSSEQKHIQNIFQITVAYCVCLLPPRVKVVTEGRHRNN